MYYDTFLHFVANQGATNNFISHHFIVEFEKFLVFNEVYGPKAELASLR